MREGRALADTLREHEDVIPALVVQMIEVGEQTGALDNMLHKVGEFYDAEVESTVNNLTSLLEPISPWSWAHGRPHGHLHVPAHVRLHQARSFELTEPRTCRPGVVPTPMHRAVPRSWAAVRRPLKSVSVTVEWKDMSSSETAVVDAVGPGPPSRQRRSKR